MSPTVYNPATRTTTITRQELKVMRFIAERDFIYSEIKNAVSRTLELRIVRENAKDPEDNRTADSVYLTAIRTWCFDNEATAANDKYPETDPRRMIPQAPIISKYRDKTARLGFRIKATENLQGTIDSLNCIVQSYARTWNGSKWSGTETPTNNPASVALKILQSPALGNDAYLDDSTDQTNPNSIAPHIIHAGSREITVTAVFEGETYSEVSTVAWRQDAAPRIGPNGNWWVGSQDTGAKAEAEDAPKYLGKTNAIPVTNEVLIQYTDTYSALVAAKVGDWVTCVQEKGCYERVDSGWRALPLYESGKYMIALKDMCESAPDAAFTAAFVKDLFAQTVNAEAVNVLMKLLVGEGDKGILIDGATGVIQSNNYCSGVEGFILKKMIQDGIQAEFTNILTKNLQVTGNFDANVTIKDFLGNSSYLAPICGAIIGRARIARWANGILYYSNMMGIKEITKISAGRYEINLGRGKHILAFNCTVYGTATEGTYNAQSVYNITRAGFVFKTNAYGTAATDAIIEIAVYDVLNKAVYDFAEIDVLLM